ncbi:MAG: SOS response-associated peptidase family protein [Chitinophagaceae bacterium]|nr:SOS response-associated peptidase family protein [Chitinophagaceae bacterium]
MCTYNGCRVSRAQYIRLMAIEKEIKNLQLNFPARNGFDYRDWPIIKPLAGGKDFEIKMAHWEYIPASVEDEFDLKRSREYYVWLNARSENLFVNDKGKLSMYREGALNGRCLVLSSGFYEWHHIKKTGKSGKLLKKTEAIPYHITLEKEPEYFYMAGVSRVWTNHLRGQSADTFAIVTAPANEMMHEIHNAQHRMPTILPEELAFEWIQDGLSEKRIMEIASYQLPADKMKAWTIAKDFLKKPDPASYYDYPEDLNLPWITKPLK